MQIATSTVVRTALAQLAGEAAAKQAKFSETRSKNGRKTVENRCEIAPAPPSTDTDDASMTE